MVKKNYYDKGIRIFWLDEAEPELSVYDHDIYRYHIGSSKQVGNVYPVKYIQTIYEGMTGEEQENVINLVRCTWAGSQRYGALVWSGDIHSSFKVLGIQVRAGLNMAIAGIPWWTTDIGGFHGGNPTDPSFRECMVRWFQYGAFCPVFRPDLLVAPVLAEGQRARSVYLPAGATWTNAYTHETIEGGQRVMVDAPLAKIPLFLKNFAVLPIV